MYNICIKCFFLSQTSQNVPFCKSGSNLFVSPIQQIFLGNGDSVGSEKQHFSCLLKYNAGLGSLRNKLGYFSNTTRKDLKNGDIFCEIKPFLSRTYRHGFFVRDKKWRFSLRALLKPEKQSWERRKAVSGREKRQKKRQSWIKPFREGTKAKRIFTISPYGVKTSLLTVTKASIKS